MNLRTFDSLHDLSHALAALVIQHAIDGQVIGISGGSTPQQLYTILGRDRALAERELTWVLIDERFVPPDHEQSNARMIRSTLFPNGIPPQQTFLAFDTTLGDPDQAAADFESRWHERGIASLHMAILGVGEDGHTASLFPNTTVLDVTDRVAAPVYVPRLDQWRVTLTLPVLQAAGLKIVQAAGRSKAAIVRDAALGADLPVTRVEPSWWFIDQEAGFLYAESAFPSRNG